MDGLQDNGGWILTGVLTLIGTLKYVWDYLKKKSDNDTAVLLHDEEKYNFSRTELIAQNKELLSKFEELELNFDAIEKKLDKAMTAFDLILPLIEQLLKDKPEYKGMFDKALKHLTVTE